VSATAVKASGGWDVTIDGAEAASGRSPAATLVVTIIGPDGKPASMFQQGKAVTELSLTAPFKATVQVKKPLPGTYTVKVASTAANAKAPKTSCESTFAIVADDKVDFFLEGDFGKERRVRLAEDSTGAPVATSGGYCQPLVGFKFGVDLKVSDSWRIAPGGGIAVNTTHTGNSSLFAEVEFNKWFDRKGYFGFNVGVWDFGHSDLVAPTAGIQFGTRLWSAGPGRNELHFVGSGRLFLDQLDDIANNYQFWGGMRYIFR
jgi:hypothetical protein